MKRSKKKVDEDEDEDEVDEDEDEEEAWEEESSSEDDDDLSLEAVVVNNKKKIPPKTSATVTATPVAAAAAADSATATATATATAPDAADTVTATAAQQKKPKRSVALIYNTESEDEEDLLPTSVRKTSKGGYSHTKRSRARISMANKGNTPWNKGKNRSEAVKAKISAGVKARNRAILLRRLSALNMTEEEWYRKKKEITYLRERIRRTKLAVKKRAAKKKKANLAQLQAQLDSVVAVAEQVKNAVRKPERHEVGYNPQLKTFLPFPPAPNQDITDTAEKKKKDGSEDEQQPANDEVKMVAEPTAPSSALFQDGVKSEDMLPQQQEKQQQQQQQEPVELQSFRMEWNPHEFDLVKLPQICPTGGPGGLVCCPGCADSYSKYMNETSRDMEGQRAHFVGRQIEEILQAVEKQRRELLPAIHMARTQTPPLGLQAAKKGSVKSNVVKRGLKQNTNESTPMDWTMTSPLDMEEIGATGRV